MMYLRSLISSHSQIRSRYVQLAAFAVALSVLPGLAQNLPRDQTSSPASQPQTGPEAPTDLRSITIPAGTNVALVLTHPIQSRYIHRGDDIYAQVTFPVESGNQVVIPAGTFVQGKVERLQTKAGRGEFRLQSAAITLQTNQGYAIKDPGAGRAIGLFALPLGGAGLGALIGHSVGKADSTVTSTMPPGCIAGPPFCTTVNTPVFGTKSKDAIIGAGIGTAIGTVASLTLLFTARHFFIDVGAPAEMTLEHPVTLKEDEIAAAARYSAEHPGLEQPVSPRPLPPPHPDMPVDHGTCYTPGAPGTPDTVIPGAPGPDGAPGPPTVIPGTPPTPGTPYPCP